MQGNFRQFLLKLVQTGFFSSSKQPNLRPKKKLLLPSSRFLDQIFLLPLIWYCLPRWRTHGVPEIMIDDLVHKGHTKLNMFSVFGEHIKSLSSKQSNLNFWNRLNPKIAFLCHFLTQTATWRPNHAIFTSSVNAIWKAMTDTVFSAPSLGGVRVFLKGHRLSANLRKEEKTNY